MQTFLADIRCGVVCGVGGFFSFFSSSEVFGRRASGLNRFVDAEYST